MRLALRIHLVAALGFFFFFKRENQAGLRAWGWLGGLPPGSLRSGCLDWGPEGVQTNDLKEVVNKLIPDSIGKDIEKACQSIYPFHDVFVRKVKMLKKPKFELGKLMELHGEGSSSGKATGDETGAKVERADGYEPPVQESV
uniref:40S ribosomal protein S3a n=1 Tax=Bos indicus x Bos taurus TaxID=30522 RepID=A0A4W2GQ58_BOBOX